MDPVFIDTAAWIALANRTDALHSAARQAMQTFRIRHVPLVTSDFVLVELADALSGVTVRTGTVAFFAAMERFAALEVVPATRDLFQKGWQLFASRPDKDWSLTDCTSFAIMTERSIQRAFTADHHFEQAGFIKLL